MINITVGMSLMIVVPLIVSVLGFRGFHITRKGFKELWDTTPKDGEDAERITGEIASSRISMGCSLFVGILGAIIFISMIVGILLYYR